MRATTAPGDQLGNFEVVAPLAEGGMAKLYLAKVAGIGEFERHIVLKLLSPAMSASDEGIEMFLEEARVLAALNHQNVARVLGIGRDRAQHFLAIEYVHGRDARGVLVQASRARHRLAYEFGVAVTARVAAGLDHVHRRCDKDGAPLGIIHRDVSPSNVMIGYDGAIKLIDFGIAKSTTNRQETQSGTIKGKYAYMSPEQGRGRVLDARSDIFALGILLYELTTQRPCFRAASDFDTMLLVAAATYAAPASLDPAFPPGLAAIIARALQVEPADRYQSAGEMLEALETLAAEEGWALSATRIAATMRALFGTVPEPWTVAPAGGGQAPTPPAAPTALPAPLLGSTLGDGEFGPADSKVIALEHGASTPPLTISPLAPPLGAPAAPSDPEIWLEQEASEPEVAVARVATPAAGPGVRDTLPEDGAPADVIAMMAQALGKPASEPRRTTLPELILFGFADEPPGPAGEGGAVRSSTGSLPVVRFAGPTRGPSAAMRVVNVTTMAPATALAPRPTSGATSLPAPASPRRRLAVMLAIGAVVFVLLGAGVLLALR